MGLSDLRQRRRTYLKSVGGTALASTLAGCSSVLGVSDGTEGSGEAEELLGAHPDELTDITFVQWAGAFREAAETAYVEPFEELAGVEVTMLDHSDVEGFGIDEIIARAHDFDMVSHWNYSLPRAVGTDAVQPVRPENVPNLDRVESTFHPSNVGYDPDDGIHHLPYSIGGNGIVYNADRMDEPSTWDRLLDGDLTGEIRMPTLTSMVMGILARQSGLDLTNVEGNERRIWDLVEQYDDQVEDWWGNAGRLDGDFAAGEVTAAGYWSGRAYALRQDGHPIEFAVPEEGTNAWIELVSIAADVADPKRRTCEALMNYAMTDRAIVDFGAEIGYAVPYDIDDDRIPEGHIYQDHPTWDLIGTDRIQTWNADILARNEANWRSRFQGLATA